MKLGYGSTAVELLTRYFEGQFTTISEVDDEIASEPSDMRVTDGAEQASLLEENIKPRTDLPPLLVHLCERRPEKLHYIGVSFGLTLDLLRFWKKQKFAPFYVGHNPTAVTGEHTCMVLKPLDNDDIETRGTDERGFLGPFYQDFRKKFTWLLGSSSFRTMEYKLAMRSKSKYKCLNAMLLFSIMLIVTRITVYWIQGSTFQIWSQLHYLQGNNRICLITFYRGTVWLSLQTM